jgi:hypothetical protein
VTLELILITAIVHTVRRGHRERWHDKWLEYRALAEMLWDVRFLSYLGEHGRMQRIGELEPESVRVAPLVSSRNYQGNRAAERIAGWIPISGLCSMLSTNM